MRQLKKILLSLRQKSEQTRDSIALGAAGVFTALVAVVWAVTLPSNLVGKSAATADAGGAFKTFFSAITNKTSHEEEILPATSSEPTLEEIVSGFIVPTTSAARVSSTRSANQSDSDAEVVQITTGAATSSQGDANQ